MELHCIPCGKPLRAEDVEESDGGVVRLVYGCPECGYEISLTMGPDECRLSSQRLTGVERAALQCFPWTERATARIERVPEVVQAMVRSGIERFARQKGYDRVDEHVLDEAKDFFEGAGITI